MRNPLLRWLLIGTAVAVVVAVAIIGGLMLFGPHRSTHTTATTADVTEPAESSGTQQIPQTRRPPGQIASPDEVSAQQVATAEPTVAALAPGGRDYVILHIGDSHTAADLFTGEVRDRLQEKFGAGGLFLPPGVPKAGVQSAEINIRADDAWTYKAMASTDEPDHFWLSGYTATVTQSGAKVIFTAKAQQAFDAIDVSFLKNNGGGRANILLDGTIVDQVSLDGHPGDPLIRRLMPPDGKIGSFKTLEVVTTSGGPVEFSGVFIDQRKTGVSYLSVGFPGARVTVLKRMAPENLADDMSRIDPDMVVLAFGTNEGFDDNLDAADYKRILTSIVSSMMLAKPGLKIVLIGPPPAARKENSCTDVRTQCGTPPVAGACWAQPPKLNAVRDAEREVAKAQGAIFWDWGSVLPTACALEQGHLGDPAIFGPDRIHMTGKGYRDSADAFAQVLIPLVAKAMGN
ncbi:MAG: GDSL-type esterase/lipase family protein [Devosia sp.]